MSVETYFTFLQVSAVLCDINMRSIRSVTRKLFLLLAVLFSKKLAGCNPITNSDLNDRIREFSSKNDSNSTAIKTLQKEESERYANFSPVRNPIRFKDVPDSALSSSSHSRGLLHHEQEHPGYTLHDYEEHPPIYGYEYHEHSPGLHGFDHHAPDLYHGHHGGHQSHHHVNYHHKNYDHALAAKAILWPIAGIALLGAAAALVSNPVLLQLGVVSGRRKRRDTEETFDSHTDMEHRWLNKKDEKLYDEDSKVINGLTIGSGKNQRDGIKFTYTSKSHDKEQKNRIPIKKYSMKREALFKKLRVHPTVQSPVEIVVDNPSITRFSTSKNLNERNLIPIPLLTKEKI